jgi:hypothetical protein
VHFAFSSLTAIAQRHKCGEFTVLNDVATALYGLVKPLEELRYLVSSESAESTIYTILEAHGVSRHYAEVLERIREQGLVAVSTIFYPLLVIEVASKPLERELLSNSRLVRLEEYTLCIPRLEHLIVKLISTRLYPYTLYGYTLFFTWLSSRRLDVELLSKLLGISGVSVEEFIREVEEMFKHLQLFRPHELDESLLEYFKSLISSVK